MSPSRLPPELGRIGKVHHVALIVRSIEDALGLWRDTLGLELETVMDIESDKVRIAFRASPRSSLSNRPMTPPAWRGSWRRRAKASTTSVWR